MAKEKHEKFEYGITPTYFLGSLDCFLQVATWYDSTDVWSLEILKSSTLLEYIGLARKHRSDSLKLHTLGSAILSPNTQWRDGVITSLANHLFAQKESKIYIIDGYPTVYIDLVKRYVLEYCEFLNDDSLASRIVLTHVNNEAEYLRECNNIEVLAYEHLRWYQPIILMDEATGVRGYVEYMNCVTNEASKQSVQGRMMGADSSEANLIADEEIPPITMEEIEEMHARFAKKKDNDDDDNQGGLQ
jgi:hypothetical protein